MARGTGPVGRALLALALIAVGCGRSTPAEALADAEQRLTGGDWDGAVELATEGLALTGGEAGVRLRLGLVKVEGLARAKHGSDARVALERLAEAYPAHVTATHYLETAQQLETAGDSASAAAVLAAGLRHFPTDAELVARSEAAHEVAVADDLPPIAPDEPEADAAAIPAPTAMDPDPMAAAPRPRRPAQAPAPVAAPEAAPVAMPAPAPVADPPPIAPEGAPAPSPDPGTPAP